MDIRIPVVNQFVSVYNLYLEIVITSLVPTPDPIVTYTSFTLAGQLSNWLPNIYPSSLYLFYTTIYDNTTIYVSTTINSNSDSSQYLKIEAIHCFVSASVL
jgi:hypothetical protein